MYLKKMQHLHAPRHLVAEVKATACFIPGIVNEHPTSNVHSSCWGLFTGNLLMSSQFGQARSIHSQKYVTGGLSHPRYPRHWAWLIAYWNRLPATLTEQPQEHLHLLFDVHHCRGLHWRWLFAFLAISISIAGSHQKNSALEDLQRPGSTQHKDILLLKYGRIWKANQLQIARFCLMDLTCATCSFMWVYLRQLPRSCQPFWPFLPGEVVTIWSIYGHGVHKDGILFRKPKSLNRTSPRSWVPIDKARFIWRGVPF